MTMADRLWCHHADWFSEPRPFNLGGNVQLVGHVVTCSSCGKRTVTVDGPGGVEVSSNV
jgi:hypothetical protein